ncbi:MAG: DMT family transporter [Bacillota bacterium]|jgi:drug/metabolite transporter (DMT)-like permease
MHQKELKSNLFLMTAAVIWGFAFVAQRIGAKYLGPFTFNGIRFAIGSFSLLPLLLIAKRQITCEPVVFKETAGALPGGLITGCILFMASSFQQIGLAESTAGKTAFITGLYIVLVPLLGIFLKQRIHFCTWMGVVAATTGLFLLSVTEKLTIAGGDLLVLAGAFLWAVHILVIDYFSKKSDCLQLSLIQFITCAALSLTVACVFEKITVTGVYQALIPLLYGGICSVGVAYTLQVMGQRYAKPAHAAIILSLESVFAGLGGFLILHEDLGLRGYLGCVLMLAGMLLSQLSGFFGNNHSVAKAEKV